MTEAEALRTAAIDRLDRLSRTRALTERESRELEKLIVAERTANGTTKATVARGEDHAALRA